jgi:hypothetical protein
MMLWKALRSTCSKQVASLKINGATVQVMRPAVAAD